MPGRKLLGSEEIYPECENASSNGQIQAWKAAKKLEKTGGQAFLYLAKKPRVNAEKCQEKTRPEISLKENLNECQLILANAVKIFKSEEKNAKITSKTLGKGIN